MKSIPVVPLLVLLSMILISSSCTRVLMIASGVKKPHLETKKTLVQYMNNHGIDTSQTWVARDTAAFRKLNSYLNDLGELLVFNKDGNLNVYADKRYCAGPVENYAGKICIATVLKIDSLKSETSLLKLLKPFTVPVKEVKDTADHITVYLIWSRWYNKLNNRVFRWRELLSEQNKNCKISIRYINIDYRAEDYGFSKRKRMHVDIN